MTLNHIGSSKQMRRPNHDYYNVSDLSYEFEKACATYKDALKTRESNRSKKELTRGNVKGTNLHKFQCNFAWIVHEMSVGHFSKRERCTDEAKTLIAHIISISE